jgi:hypothetical protein
MDDFLIFGDTKYISAAHAARISGLSQDYIGRLCREVTLNARRVGKNWYVSEDSLHTFLLEREYQASERNASLAEDRRRAYEASVSGVAASVVQNQIAETAPAVPVDVNRGVVLVHAAFEKMHVRDIVPPGFRTSQSRLSS